MSVGYAVSSDRLNWTKVGKVSSVEGYLYGVIKEEGIYRIWYGKTSSSGLAETYYAENRAVPFGDLDDSGQVTIADAILALKMMAGGNVAGMIRLSYRIGLPEVIYIMQKIAGIRR